MKDCITLELPLEKENILVARLAASGFAGLNKLDIEATEDIRIAVNEALIVLLKQGYRSARIEFRSAGDVRIEVTGADGETLTPLEEHDLSVVLLNELVDSVEPHLVNGITDGITLIKKR